MVRVVLTGREYCWIITLRVMPLKSSSNFAASPRFHLRRSAGDQHQPRRDFHRELSRGRTSYLGSYWER